MHIVHPSQQTTLAGMKKRKKEKEEGVRQKKCEEIYLKTCLHRTHYIQN